MPQGADVEAGIRRVLDDDELVRRFWHRGYEELSNHVGNGATRWVGARLLSMIGGALIAAGLWLGFKFGGWGQ